MRLAALAALCATVAARQDHLCEEDVCFYHVPKTGGDSFKYLLRDELIFGSFRRAFRAFSSFSSPVARLELSSPRRRGEQVRTTPRNP